MRCLAFVWIFVFYATFRAEDIDTLHRIYDSADAHYYILSVAVFGGLLVGFLATYRFEVTDTLHRIFDCADVLFRAAVWFSRQGQARQGEV